MLIQHCYDNQMCNRLSSPSSWFASLAAVCLADGLPFGGGTSEDSPSLVVF
jgi:hypothetical protein